MTIKVAIFDVDGTLTDGEIYHFDSVQKMTPDEIRAILTRGRSFSTLDGNGIQLLRESGVQVWVCGGDDSPHLKDRLDWLGIDAEHRLLGPKDKRDILKMLPALEMSEIAFMGNDVPDLPLMELVGLPGCPLDAHEKVFSYIQDGVPNGFLSYRDGGQGAVREFCDYIIELNAKG